MTDEDLMSQVKEGQLEKLSELYHRYAKRIYNYFLKSTLKVADSDDLTQDLFIRIMKYRKSYKIGQSVQFWVFQIARNMLKDHFRKMKVHTSRFSQTDIIPDVVDDSFALQPEKEKKLYQAMKALGEEKRELLVLSKFDGMKYEQIAALRKTSVSNIKVQVHRTIKELRDHYFEIKEE